MSKIQEFTATSYKDELMPYKLLFNLDADDVFLYLQVLLFGWLAIMLVPRFKYTTHVVLSLVLSTCIVYALTAISVLVFPADGHNTKLDFSSLDGIVKMFEDPNAVMVGWLHYAGFDLMIAWVITMDSIVNCGVSQWFHYTVMLPILVCALMMPPLGFAVYVFVRLVFLNSNIEFDNSGGYRPIETGKQSSE